MGDVDVSDDAAGAVTITGQTTVDNPNGQQENKGDTTTLTPGVAVKPQTTTTQQAVVADDGNGTAKSILSRDGKHTIPYGVLEAERAEKQRLSEANQRASTELAEARRQLEVFTRQISAIASTCRLTFAQAVYWVDPLLTAIDQANSQLARIREIEELHTTYTGMYL
nr:hypothetical protein [Pectobacterium brasiliense]